MFWSKDGADPVMARELLARLTRVERKLDLLLEVQGISPPEPEPDTAPIAPTASIVAVAEILGLLRRGQKIAAIERYREDTGGELSAAQEAVEAMEREHLRR